MSDETAKAARLMNVIDAILLELDRQGVIETVSALGFNPTEIAKAVIKAADGNVVPFPGSRAVL